MRNVIACLILLILCACKEETKQQTIEPQLKIGSYRAILELQDNEKLPFNFEVTSASELKVFNAEEVIDVDEITYNNDSVFINFPVFEGYVAAKLDGDNLNGNFIKESLNRVVPFSAEFDNATRFNVSEKPSQNVSGIWETVFSIGIVDDEYIAKGIFKQEGKKVTGTFRTTTGDYRYLEGVMDGDQMKLSTFDGAHAFLFTAKVTDSTMEGLFYSGNHWKEPFIAKRNKNFELPNSNDLTFLKDGYDALDFAFPNTSDELVSLKDDRFKNKVVVVQIMGTWCPNCLDESKYYAEFYKNNKDKDIEFVALAFEYAKTKEAAFSRIDRLQSKIDINYPILLAQYGTSDKAKAQEKLPMLNHVLSYPTSIFIDKKGKVRKIHTGFNGPATGEKYVEFKEEFEGFVDDLLLEQRIFD
ncbi:peroxiredoxin family protein [Winogradskyella endarachnes]|uniref:Redoxin family protein n=1 Tax=Winogradskyella endarachnes TaxID=2681965 RepID=A0A6L6UBY6_9FLAO|nr:TlpA disulfide reductase family protein [Winogradskyella endarachnes]MUU78417.1 redoxin family protein [Winogradskyella endarachnes]